VEKMAPAGRTTTRLVLLIPRAIQGILFLVFYLGTFPVFPAVKLLITRIVPSVPT
jgi:hypothetical protein